MSATIIIAIFFVILLVLVGAYRKKALVREAHAVNANCQVVLIGIDGGCWKIIEPLINQGKLPNIERLIRNGAHGDLIPESPFSPPSWTSIATGLSSKKHGIYAFAVHLSGQTESILTRDSMVKGLNIWEVVESEGKRVGVLEWIFLPEYPKGRFISRAEKYVLALTLGIRFVLNVLRLKHARFSRSSWERICFLQENVRADWQIALTLYLLKRNEPHFFALRLRGTDSFQHLFWKYHYPHYYDADSSSTRKYGSAISDLYQKVDRFVGRLMKKQDRKFMIVSDHGFRGFSRDQTQPLWLLHSVEYRKLLNKLGFLHFEAGKGTIDWKRTQLYPCGDPRVFHEFAINLEGRESNGMVSVNDYERIKEKVKKALEAIRFKDTGERLFRRISLHDGTPYGRHLKFHFMEEEFHLWNNDSFDILIEEIYECRFQDPFLLEREIIIGSRSYKLGEFVTPSAWSATHSTKGIFVANGQHIRPGRIEAISTMDIAPTLLYWMNIAIPRSMEGKVKQDIFNEGFINRNPIKFSEKDVPARSDVDSLSNEEEERIKQDLRNLGYL